MTIVIDASVALSWMFSDEQSDLAQAIMVEVAERGAVVPSLWPLEVGNVLLMGVRRGRLTASQRDASLSDLSELDIEIDDQTSARAWAVALPLAERFALTLYDAAYLELAQRRDMPLATLDRQLGAAAEQLGLIRL